MGIIERVKRASAGGLINFVCFVVSIIVGVVGLLLPPRGQIDPSVLIFIGELGVFSTISQIPDFVKSLKGGASLEINKGDTHIKIDGEDSK